MHNSMHKIEVRKDMRKWSNGTQTNKQKLEMQNYEGKKPSELETSAGFFHIVFCVQMRRKLPNLF